MSVSQWRAGSDSAEHEILINQYLVAADLYKHEDELNWQKVNHLLYLNAALGAILGFVIERGSNGLVGFGFGELLVVVSLAGLLVSSGFALTVWLGTNYLQTRKAAVIVVEERLKALGGEYVVKPNEALGRLHSRFQQASPTRWVLRLVPIGLALLWLAILFYLLKR